jgi:hypothetical protein
MLTTLLAEGCITRADSCKPSFLYERNHEWALEPNIRDLPREANCSAAYRQQSKCRPRLGEVGS